MKLAQANAALLELLSQGADIQTIIDQGAAMVGEPLLVADTRFRILYMSATIDPQIQEWQQAKKSRYISDDVLANMEETDTARQINDSSAPVRAELPNGYHAARCALRYRGGYRGFVGMYDYQRPFTENDMAILESVCRAVNALLPSDSDLNSVDEDAYESLLYQLLRCTTEEQAAQVYQKHPVVNFGKQKHLLAFRTDRKTKKPLARLKKLFHQTLYHHVSVVLDDRLIMLLESERMGVSLYQQTLQDIERLAEMYHLRVGVSFPFTDPAFFPSACRQAEICLQQKQGMPQTGVSYFEEHLVDSIAELCVKEHPAAFFIHPIVQRIKEYDATYHVNYLDTLREYIRCAGSLKVTAANLGVHYNTMKYRISAIENIAGESLHQQGELLAALYFSLLLDKRIDGNGQDG